MKKIALAALIAAPLCACDKAPKSDFDTVSAAVQAAGAEAVVSTGAMGDTLVKVPATKGLLKIYEQEKNTMFLSANEFVAEEGSCLVNVVNEMEYRLFCGSMENITPDAMWAVQIVKPVETEAVAEEGVAEEAPVAEETATEEASAEAPVAE